MANSSSVTSSTQMTLRLSSGRKLEESRVEEAREWRCSRVTGTFHFYHLDVNISSMQYHIDDTRVVQGSGKKMRSVQVPMRVCRECLPDEGHAYTPHGDEEESRGDLASIYTVFVIDVVISFRCPDVVLASHEQCQRCLVLDQVLSCRRKCCLIPCMEVGAYP